MKLNNKGFTMVELLVAMAIMGLLVIMAFPTIRAIQTNNTETKYEEYGKAVVSAAKLYVDSYGADVFDSSNNQKKSINLDQLIKKDLIKDINVSESTCIDGSSVNVIKYKDDYTYCLNLICKAKGSTKDVYKKLSQEGQCKDLELYKVYYTTIDNALLKTVSEIAGNDHKVLSAGEAGFNTAGHEFKYWNNGSNKVYAGSKIEVNGNITLVAYSEACPYTITYKSALGGVTGGIKANDCFYGQTCKLKANGYSKDYYKFKNYVYNSVSYSPGKEMNGIITPPANCSVTNVKNYDVTVAFEKNQVTTSYYSNGGTLVPSNSQSCPSYAGCSKSQCVWPQDSKCKGKTGLVFTNTYNFDATGMSVNGVRDYTSAGSLAMTRKGCTQTGKWLVDSATSSTKIIQSEKFATAKDYVNKAGKGEAFKKGNVSINLIAEWDCPSAITCPAGKYLPANKTTCATCTSGNYCVGGTFYKKSTNQGLTPCPNGYKNSAAGSKTIGNCYAKVSCGKYIKTKNSTTPTNCSSGTFNTAHNVNYGSTSKCKTCPTGYETSGSGSCGCTKKRYTITISKGTGIDWVTLDGSKTTLKKTVPYGTSVKINADPSDYYQIEKWTDSSGAKKYSNAENTIPVTSNMTLTAVARTNKITVIYYFKGGKLQSGPKQKCLPLDSPKLPGCRKDECSNANTCYKTPGKDDYGYDESWAKEGLRNYSQKKNGSIYLTRSGKKATGYWHLYSDYDTNSKHKKPQFYEEDAFPKTNTGLYLAKKCGDKYANDLKTKDITIKLYAGWKNP